MHAAVRLHMLRGLHSITRVNASIRLWVCQYRLRLVPYRRRVQSFRRRRIPAGGNVDCGNFHLLFFRSLCYIQRTKSSNETQGMLDDYFRQYGLISVFIALAVAVPVGMLMASFMFSLLNIRPSVPSVVKQSIYECGFETISGRWNNFNFRHYSLALDFVIFDVVGNRTANR